MRMGYETKENQGKLFYFMASTLIKGYDQIIPLERFPTSWAAK